MSEIQRFEKDVLFAVVSLFGMRVYLFAASFTDHDSKVFALVGNAPCDLNMRQVIIDGPRYIAREDIFVRFSTHMFFIGMCGVRRVLEIYPEAYGFVVLV